MGANNYTMLAKTLYGLEDVLADELKQLGAIDVKKGVRIVSFKGDKGFMYKANLSLRTALTILKPIASFKARNENQLYDGMRQINWSEYLQPSSTLAVQSTLATDFFNHSQYVALKTKDAIVDQFRDRKGQRPNVDTRHPDLKIQVHINRDRVNASLDSSGETLNKRGYREATNIAPINEVLAAGCLLLSDWDRQSSLIDPMCGSGTIAIEAAMIAANIPANIHRPEFGFEKWADYDNALFETIEESVLKKATDFQGKIYARDKAPSAFAKAKQNIHNAQLSDFIEVEQADFFESEGASDSFLLFNPPYDERLGIDVEKFYGQIGDTLKSKYPNSTAWFITGNLDAIKHVGLRASRKIKLYNGKLEARLCKYELYRGSKKASKS